MRIPTYTLPDPAGIERVLLRLISGQSAISASWKTFSNGELYVRIGRAGRTAVVVGKTAPPAENFLRTLLLVDTLRRSGAERITLVLPYLAYARQDRVILSGEPLSALCILEALANAGVTRVVTADLHSERVRSASPVPVASVSMIPTAAASLRRRIGSEPCTIVSPDKGAVRLAETFASALGGSATVAWLGKRRDPRTGRVATSDAFGALAGQTAVIVDDMLDTGATVREAVRLLRRKGFREFHLCVTHPVFSKGAVALLRGLKFKSITVSDTLPLPKDAKRLSGLHVVSAAGALASAAVR